MTRPFLPPSRNDVNLWRVPLALSVIAVAFFGFTIAIDTLSARGLIYLPAWLSNGGIDDARAILSSEMSAVSTVLALIFSVSLLVLSMVATLFGPRLLYRFVKDWVTQVTIGLFLSTFVYILLAFVATRADNHEVFIPQLTLLSASVLVLVSFGFLVYYSHRIAVSIQNPDMVARIVDDIERILQTDSQTERGNPKADPPGPEVIQNQLTEGAMLKCWTGGYVQGINQLTLASAAAQADAVIHLLFRTGQYVYRGEPVACVWPASSLSSIQEIVERNIHIGRHRVLLHDVEFGLCQIVEIGIRALSPAINDSFTGVACVDCIGDALRILAETPPNNGNWYDSNGNLRLREPQLKFERLAKVACDQLRQAAADNPAVIIRLLTTIERVAAKLQHDTQRQALLEQASAIWEAANTDNLVTLDRQNIESAYLKTKSSLVKLTEVQQEKGGRS
jgi:uncharacterized membrane protein